MKVWLEVPHHWGRSIRFLEEAFHVEIGKRAGKHWYGGPSQHRAAKCRNCKRHLRLVWDIDIRDQKLPQLLRETFDKLTRLPIYYCFNCPEATAYQVIDDSKIRSINSGADGGDETPYNHETKVPTELPRRPLKFKRIPHLIEGLRCLEQQVGFLELDEDATTAFDQFNGGLDFSQFGGAPKFLHSFDAGECPNPRCKTRKQQVFAPDQGGMRLLATIESDGVDGFEWVCAPLQCEICWCCKTIRVCFGYS